MRICLVRHGETAWNAEHRLQGWTDVPLNPQGLRQAQATARELAGLAFDAIVASPLARALVTAQTIAAGRPVATDPRLRERHYGDLQGLTRHEIATRAPSLHEAMQTRRPGHQPPGGESVEIFAARVHAALEALRQRFAQQTEATVLVVAHGGTLDMAYRLASGQDLHSPRQHALPNAALNWLRASPKGWAVEAWGLTEHLHLSLDETGG